jgi:hypothetical protein
MASWKDQITGSPEAHHDETTNTALLDNLVAFIPDLAMSLDNLSNRLADLGYQEEVLESIREAVVNWQQTIPWLSYQILPCPSIPQSSRP